MLVISNGAYRSGSTWLYQTALEIVPSAPIPARYADPKWSNQNVAAEKLAEFLAAEETTRIDYVYKSHYAPADGVRELVLAHPYARLLNIHRDARDVFVSAYFRSVRKNRFAGSFADFYARRGRSLTTRIGEYHRYWDWRRAPDRIFLTSYERLHAAFDSEADRLARFLGRTPDPHLLERIRRATRFDSKTPPGVPPGQSHYRKGIVGDWQNHLTPAEGDAIAEIESALRIHEIIDALPPIPSSTPAFA